MRAWWREGRLCLTKHETDTRRDDIARGPIAELIIRALALPAEVQALAHIEYDDDSGVKRLSFAEIHALSLHRDFPIII